MHKSAYTNKGIWNDTPKQKKNLRSVQFIWSDAGRGGQVFPVQSTLRHMRCRQWRRQGRVGTALDVPCLRSCS